MLQNGTLSVISSYRLTRFSLCKASQHLHALFVVDVLLALNLQLLGFLLSSLSWTSPEHVLTVVENLFWSD